MRVLPNMEIYSQNTINLNWTPDQRWDSASSRSGGVPFRQAQMPLACCTFSEEDEMKICPLCLLPYCKLNATLRKSNMASENPPHLVPWFSQLETAIHRGFTQLFPACHEDTGEQQSNFHASVEWSPKWLTAKDLPPSLALLLNSKGFLCMSRSSKILMEGRGMAIRNLLGYSWGYTAYMDKCRDHVGLNHDMVNKFRDGKILYPPAVKVERHLPRFRNWEFANAIFGYLRGSKDGHLLGGFPDF